MKTAILILKQNLMFYLFPDQIASNVCIITSVQFLCVAQVQAPLHQTVPRVLRVCVHALIVLTSVASVAPSRHYLCFR